MDTANKQSSCLIKILELLLRSYSDEKIFIELYAILYAYFDNLPNFSFALQYINKKYQPDNVKTFSNNKYFDITVFDVPTGNLWLYYDDDIKNTNPDLVEQNIDFFDNITSCLGSSLENNKNIKSLVSKAKLESLGSFAGDIAHKFNNLLTGILGNLTYAKIDIDENLELYKVLSDAEEAGWQARNLTYQLLSMSDRSTTQKQPVYLKTILENSVRDIDQNKSFYQLSIPDNLHEVIVDIDQVHQSLKSLLDFIYYNQKEASSGLSTGVHPVLIKAENVTLPENHHYPIKPGKYVLITIDDVVLNITETEKERLFEPMFNAANVNAGLTLSFVYSMIIKNEGYISLYTKTDNKLIFRIFLPVLCNTKSEKESKTNIEKVRILIMDDEELLRTVAVRACNRFGYHVDVSSNGNDAVSLYKRAYESGIPYHIVILDLIVPDGMGGKETIKELLEIDPLVNAIVCSGYINNPIMRNHKDYGFKGMIVKPFKFSELKDTVESILNTKANN